MPVSDPRLPAQYEDDTGRIDYTAAGQADADLTSAKMALEAVLRRKDLTSAQRRAFQSALRHTTEAARAVYRHVNTDLDAR